MSHTPGPWHVCEGNRHIISDSHHMKVAETAQIVSGNLSTMKTEYVPGHKMQAANAALIAAAPEMLSILKRIIAVDDRGDTPSPSLMEEALAVVKKAEP